MGRPRAFATVEDLQRGIDGYFEECTSKEEPVTVSGLAYALEVDRKTINNYSRDDEYFPTVKRAVAFIEKEKVRDAMTGKYDRVISIFDLKNNHDWKDEKNINQDNSGTQTIRFVQADADKEDAALEDEF